MQSEPSAAGPLNPHEPGFDLPKRRAALLPAWLAVTLLLLLLGFVLVRNFLHDQRPRAQSYSDLIQKERTVVAETKTAFSMVYAHKRLRAVTVSTLPVGELAPAPKPNAPGAPAVNGASIVISSASEASLSASLSLTSSTTASAWP